MHVGTSNRPAGGIDDAAKKGHEVRRLEPQDRGFADARKPGLGSAKLVMARRELDIYAQGHAVDYESAVGAGADRQALRRAPRARPSSDFQVATTSAPTAAALRLHRPRARGSRLPESARSAAARSSRHHRESGPSHDGKLASQNPEEQTEAPSEVPFGGTYPS